MSKKKLLLFVHGLGILKDVNVKRVSQQQKDKNINKQDVQFTTNSFSSNHTTPDKSFTKVAEIATIIGTIVAIITLIISFTDNRFI